MVRYHHTFANLKYYNKEFYSGNNGILNKVELKQHSKIEILHDMKLALLIMKHSMNP